MSADELVDLVLQLQHTATQVSSARQNGVTDTSLHSEVSVNSTAPHHNIDEPSQGYEHYQKALDAQTSRAALLTQVALELNDLLDMQAIVERVLRVTATTLNITEVSILLVDPNGGLEMASAIHDGVLNLMPSDLARKALDCGLLGWVLRHRHSVILLDVAHDSRWVPCWTNQTTGSAIALPIKQAGTALGVMTVFHKEPRRFTNHDLVLLEGVGAQLGVALAASRRRLNESLRREQALTLLSISQYLAAERSFEELAGMLQEKSVALFEAAYGLLFLASDHAALEPVIMSSVLRKTSLLEESTCAAALAQEQGSITTHTIRSSDEVRTYVALPLMHNGELIGVIVLVRIGSEEVAFSANTWSLLTVFASFIAAACSNKRLIAQLRSYTATLEDLITERTQQMQRSRDMLRIVFDTLPCGLLLLDADERLLAANNAFCLGLLGQHPRQVVGQPYATIWSTLEQHHKMQIALREPPLSPAVEVGTDIRKIWLRCMDAAGEYHLFEVTRHPIVGVTDPVVQYLEHWSNMSQ